jgi:type II secretory pathway pseudopilin PulG
MDMDSVWARRRSHRARNAGITLVEILIATLIVAILSATLWMVLAPRTKESAFEVQIKNDLKQLVSGLHVYMADNDDKYAPMMTSLPDTLPKRMKATRAMRPDATGRYLTELDYNYTYTTFARRVEKYFNPTNRFDPAKNAIFKAPFHPRKKKGIHYQITSPGVFKAHQTNNAADFLGVRMDGSIAWFNFWELWEYEMAYYGPQLPRGARE